MKSSELWDVISTCSTWVYEPIKRAWVYVVLLYMIRIIILGSVILLDPPRVMTEYSLEKGSVNEQRDVRPDQI